MFSWLKKTQPKLTTGQQGELLAQQEYTKRGFAIIAANEFNRKGKRMGEIDFIAKNRQSIVFVEVKTRTEGEQQFGSAVEAVNYAKQRKILKAVHSFLLRNPMFRSLRPQIDVCVVELYSLDKSLKSVTIIPNAVEDFH